MALDPHEGIPVPYAIQALPYPWTPQEKSIAKASGQLTNRSRLGPDAAFRTLIARSSNTGRGREEETKSRLGTRRASSKNHQGRRRKTERIETSIWTGCIQLCHCPLTQLLILLCTKSLLPPSLLLQPLSSLLQVLPTLLIRFLEHTPASNHACRARKLVKDLRRIGASCFTCRLYAPN